MGIIFCLIGLSLRKCLKFRILEKEKNMRLINALLK